MKLPLSRQLASTLGCAWWITPALLDSNTVDSAAATNPVGNLTGLPKERFRSVGISSSDCEDQHAPSFRIRVLEEPGRPPLSEGLYGGGVFRKRGICWKRPVETLGIRSFERGVGWGVF